MASSPDSAVERLLETLDGLPAYRGVTFRGWNGTDRWSSGAGSFVTTGLTPTSRDPRVASENFTSTGLYAVVCRTGRAIEQFSADRAAREVVLLPATILLWGRQVRVGDVRVTLVEEVVLGEEQADEDGRWTPEEIERTVAARVLDAVGRPPVDVGQPGRFVGPFE